NVKVQMIRPKNKHKSDIKSAIDETAKYPVKDTDFMTDDEERNLQRLADLEEGLYRKRLISYGGLLKEIHKELRSEEHTSELQSRFDLVCRLLLEKKHNKGRLNTAWLAELQETMHREYEVPDMSTERTGDLRKH